jgi:hypothetical protein
VALGAEVQQESTELTWFDCGKSGTGSLELGHTYPQLV